MLSVLPILLVVAAADTVTNPFSGGTLKHHVGDGQDLWVLRVDLCAPGVSVRGTADGERGRTVSSFASLVGAEAAINGDFFGGGFSTDGPAGHDGFLWGGDDHTYVAPVSFGSAHVDIPHHNNTSGAPVWAREVVSGHPTLLDDGAVVGNPGDPLCTNRHPRTALGITQDRRTLIVLVVDGRRPGAAAGMTCDEMAFVLALEGAFDAVNLDGGGSSTLVVNGAVKNQPSDGSQRTVGNHLAFQANGSGPSPQCPDFIDPVCDGDANLQDCSGPNDSVVTSCEDGAPIANGDCGFFGAGCSVAGGTGHCVHPYCLINLDGGETGSFCVDDTKLATCDLGVYGEGDCAAYGGICSDGGGSGHCVHFLCHANLDGGEDGTFCLDDGTLSSCTLGAYAERACGDGCVDDDGAAANGVGARCGEDPAPPVDQPDVPPDEEPVEPPDDPNEPPGDIDPGDDGPGVTQPAPPLRDLPSSVGSGCASNAQTSSSPPAALALLALALASSSAHSRRRLRKRSSER